MKNDCRPPLSELLENDAIRKTLSADANPLQDPVASQLIQNQVGLQLPRLEDGEIPRGPNQSHLPVDDFMILISFRLK